MRRWVAWTVMLLGLAACERAPSAPAPPVHAASPPPLPPAHRWAPEARAAAIAEGREVLERLECARCHTIDDVPPAGRSEHCVSCHVFLDGLAPSDPRYQTIASRYGEDTLRRYQANIEHYRAVPDLTAIGRRLRPAWIQAFVAAPFDVRPAMEEAMPRVRVTDAEARAIARYVAAVAEAPDPDGPPRAVVEPTRDEARIARGRALFAARGCNACHYVGNLRLGRTEAEIAAAGLPARLAPNLRFVRERMDADVVVAWIVDPQRLAPGTPMPDLNVGAEDAALIRDFLWFADPALEPPPEVVARLPAALDRPVPWAEVKARVLGRVCVHCHMNDHERDRGPGNAGGWGWPARHLRMRTYEALVAGAELDAGGDPRSVLAGLVEHAPPPILGTMLARRFEEPRDHVRPFHDHERPPYPDAPPGMPMGLPSIPDDELALVRTWLEGGCPGPTEVTGMPGITDGLLVPDGPVEPPSGCEARPLAEPRPAWASQPPPAWARDPAPPRPSPAGPTSPTSQTAPVVPSPPPASAPSSVAPSPAARSAGR